MNSADRRLRQGSRRVQPSRNRSPRALPLAPTEWAEEVIPNDAIAPIPRDKRSPARKRQEAGLCPVLNAYREGRRD